MKDLKSPRKNIGNFDIDHLKEIQKKDDGDNFILRRFLKFTALGLLVFLMIIALAILIRVIYFAWYDQQAFTELTVEILKFMVGFILGAFSDNFLKKFMNATNENIRNTHNESHL